MKKSLNKKTLFTFIFFGVAIASIVGLLLFVCLGKAKGETEFLPVLNGSVIYNENGQATLISEDGTIKKLWTGEYVYKNADEKFKVSLGTNAVITNGNSIYIVGGGYRFLGDTSTIKLGSYYESNLTDNQFYKLADRKYLLIANEIHDDTETVKTTKFLFILMDKQGNAQLINDEISGKTQVPTVIYGDAYTFDIANEILSIGEKYTIDMRDVITSTNEFDRQTYKNPNTGETNLNPEEIDVDVSGGKGGDGGIGGEGGQGGNGGRGSNAEQSDIVKEITLLGVQRYSTSLKVNYYANDPFAQFGLIYLALYPNDVDIYDPRNQKLYITNKMFGVNVYNNTLTFNDLDPNTKYQVVIGHIIEGEDDWYVDDVMRTTTLNISNSIQLVSQTANYLELKLKLDPYYNNYAYGRIEMYVNEILNEGTNACSYALKRANNDNDTFNVSTAASKDGVTIRINYSLNDQIRKSEIIQFDVALANEAGFALDPDTREKLYIIPLSSVTTNGYYNGANCDLTFIASFTNGLDNNIIKSVNVVKDSGGFYYLTFIDALDPTTLGSAYDNGWGMKFEGWRIAGRDSDAVYKEGEKLLIDSSVTVEAVWSCPEGAALTGGKCICEKGKADGATAACKLS